jgi:hypothetical protein
MGGRLYQLVQARELRRHVDGDTETLLEQCGKIFCHNPVSRFSNTPIRRRS